MHQITEVLVKEPHEALAVEAHVVQEEEVIEELGEDKVQEFAVEAAAAAAVEQSRHITTDNQEGEDKHNLNLQPQILYKEQILQW